MKIPKIFEMKQILVKLDHLPQIFRVKIPKIFEMSCQHLVLVLGSTSELRFPEKGRNLIRFLLSTKLWGEYFERIREFRPCLIGWLVG